VSISWIPSNARVLELEDDIDGVFAVHDVSTRGGGRVVVFSGQFLRSPEMVYDEIATRFRARGYLALLRHEGGRDVLIAYPAPTMGAAGRPVVNLVLFLVTVVTTLMAGTFQALPPDLVGRFDLALIARHWTLGIPFAAALLGILGIHELGHYFVARHYGLDVSLPYFIPFPGNFFTGTLGAVIRIQSPFESRRALFDVGIAGPLAGLAVAIPVTVAGLATARMVPVSDGAMVFNEPLLFQWLAGLVLGPRPAGMDVLLNPLLMAGWLGFLITALNLVPVSQLDGGHISYALFGRYHRLVAWAVFLVAATVTLTQSPGYIVMLGLVFFMGIEHPPALNDLTPIGPARRVLGVLTLLLFLALVTVNPFG